MRLALLVIASAWPALVLMSYLAVLGWRAGRRGEVCRCGHARATHFRRQHMCMESTPTVTWACDCQKFRGKFAPPLDIAR